MRIELSDELQGYINTKVQSGFYGNGAEVIRDALRHMMEDDDYAERKRRLLAAVQMGADQLARGEGREWTPDRWNEINREAKKRIQEGRRPKADVCP